MFTLPAALLAAALVSAQPPTSTTTHPASHKPIAHRADATNLLEALPDDACVAILADLHGDTLIEDLIASFERAQLPQAEGPGKLTALVKSIPGDIGLGIVTDPRHPDDPDFVVVMDVSRPGFDTRDWLEHKLLPYLRSRGRRDRYAELRIEGKGGAMRIVDPRTDNKTLVYIAVRGGNAVLSTRANLARAATTGRKAEKSFADAKGIRRALRELPRDAAVRVLFNPAPLIKAQKKPKPKTVEAIVQQILSPDDLVAAGGYLRWTHRAIEAGAHAVLADECKGIAQWLDRPNSESKLMSDLAGDFPILFRVGISSLVALPEGVYKITDSFDDTISTEYREDLAAFNKETGIDFNADILGQLHDEIVIAVRPDLSKKPPVAWTAIIPVTTPDTLESAAGKLAEHYDLAFDSRPSEGVTIHSAPEGVHFAWCVAGKRLILADDLTTARDVVRCFKPGANHPSPSIVDQCKRELGAENQVMLLTDVGLLCRQAPMLPMLASPRFAPVLGGGYVGAALSKKDRVIHLEAHWEIGRQPGAGNKSTQEDASNQLVATLANSVAESLAEARRQAARAISMANLRGIAMACFVYANKHDGRFPESLESFAAEQPDQVPLQFFANTYTGERPESPSEIAKYGNILYRAGLTTKSAPSEVVLAEKSIQSVAGSQGACFAFVDGHCELVAEPVANRLIEMIRAGEPTITIGAAKASLGEQNAP